MARYTTHNKRESGNKTKTVLAVLIIIVLVFTILAGLVKSFALPGSAFEPNSAWDGKSSFAVALDTNPPSVFIYQREPKRIVFLGLDGNMYFVTGNPKTPVAKISDAISGSKGFDIARVMALSFGAPITNYAALSKRENLDNKVAQKMFKDFASLTTPFIVMTRGKPSFIKNTNITRYDAFRLWWQVKGLSVESVNVSDISALSEEIVVGGGRKVLGADATSLNRKIHDYLENINSYAEIEHSELIKKHREKMVHYLTLLFLKQITHSPMSEIIVAGFGRNDIYPYLVKVSVEGIFENHIRMSTPVIHKIGTYYPNGNGDRRLSSVLSFAQTDGADMILGGVNREFEDFFHQNKDKNLVELLTFIEKHAIISQLEKQKQTRITSDIDHFTYRQVHNFRNELKHFKDTNYTSPIINSVRYMGVGDICELARTMVNLTSIIRRYSINQRETVGGEIDVVVLSKEEGGRRKK